MAIQTPLYTMPSYKLTYFNFRGRGETARILFKLAGVEFEDVRVVFPEEWIQVKPKTPYGQLPILEVDGKQLTESRAIFRYLGREFGYYGDSNWEKSQIDCCLDMLDPLHHQLTNDMFFVKGEEQERMRAEYERLVLGFLANLEKKLKENNGGDGYFVGNKMTVADIQLFNDIDMVPALTLKKDIYQGFPKLCALRERVGQNPTIAKWVAERPKTPY